MATLENRSSARPEKKDRSTARRKPFLITALSAALVIPALIATVSLAEPQPEPTSNSADAVASVPDSAYPTVVVPTTATAVSVKKSTKLDFSLAKVVKVAEKYRGVRYRYGGSTPAGFDCSGYTKYVFAKFGINLPHSAAAQGRLGDRVSRANAKPGDLVVTSGGAHVGIYLGKGRFIDAPMPGQVVHARTIYTSNYYIVRVDDDTRNV